MTPRMTQAFQKKTRCSPHTMNSRRLLFSRMSYVESPPLSPQGNSVAVARMTHAICSIFSSKAGASMA